MWELGEAEVALQSFDGTFVTSVDHRSATATVDTLTESAIFTRIALTENTFALRARNGKFVGANQQGNGLSTDRTTIGPRERLAWSSPTHYLANAMVASRLGGLTVDFDFGAGDRGRFVGSADEELAAGCGVGTTVFNVPPETLPTYARARVVVTVFFPFTTRIEWLDDHQGSVIGEMNAAGLGIPIGGSGTGRFYALPR